MKKVYVLTGDHNLDLLKLNHHTYINDFHNIIVSHHLAPIITKPTRVTEFSATLINNLFINTFQCPCKGTIFFYDTSDRFPIVLEIGNRYVFNKTDLKVKVRKYDSFSIDCCFIIFSKD